MRYQLILIFLSAMLVSKAEINSEGGIALSKKITKSFDCPASKLVAAANSYGNITIVVSSGTQVRYDINITAKADSKAKAQEEIDRVSVKFNDGPSKVLATTDIESKSSWFNWSWGGSTELDINYTIYVPDNRSLDLNQTYGNVHIPNYNGPISLDVSYGNIKVADLGNKLKVELSYGEGSLGCIKNATMDLDYSDLSINSAASINSNLQYGKFQIVESCDALTIDADYSEIELGNVGKLNATGGYNHFNATNLGDTKISNEYGDLSINYLKGNLNIDSDYHATKVLSMGSSVREINLNGDYSSLKLTADGYNYNVSGDYLNVKAPGSSSESNSDDSKTYRGSKKGKGVTMIKVTGDYVNVSLK
jgi:hypothetical protein